MVTESGNVINGIDIHKEQLVKVCQAGSHVPPSGVSTATISRWYLKGVHGVRLETVVIGKARYTSVEAIERFIQAQNPVANAEPVVTAKRRKSMAQSAVSQLEAAGA